MRLPKQSLSFGGGGIAELPADLAYKSRDEVITGDWQHTGQLKTGPVCRAIVLVNADLALDGTHHVVLVDTD